MTTKNKYFNTLETKFGHLSFGNALKSIRLGENKTQKEFALKLEISPQNLNDLEHDRKTPSPTRASQIAKKLKLPEVILIQLALRDQLKKEGFDYSLSIS